jgi:hypothetical protein
MSVETVFPEFVLMSKGRLLLPEVTLADSGVWNSATPPSFILAYGLPDRETTVDDLCGSIDADVSVYHTLSTY